jgi:hypothetical protein
MELVIPLLLTAFFHPKQKRWGINKIHSKKEVQSKLNNDLMSHQEIKNTKCSKEAWEFRTRSDDSTNSLFRTRQESRFFYSRNNNNVLINCDEWSVRDRFYNDLLSILTLFTEGNLKNLQAIYYHLYSTLRIYASQMSLLDETSLTFGGYELVIAC